MMSFVDTLESVREGIETHSHLICFSASAWRIRRMDDDLPVNLGPGRLVDRLAAGVALNLRCFGVELGSYPRKTRN
jgi:hypothetical protein